jgi:predicted enzyme related to lactoylglutathione lyase
VEEGMSDQKLKVEGFGGFFFRASNPEELAQWYEDNLGVAIVPKTYEEPCWQQAGGTTVFAPFKQDSDHFRDNSKQWMINFRVADLAAMVAQLEAAGNEVDVDPQEYPNGWFAFLRDPEGNPIELWQEKT